MRTNIPVGNGFYESDSLPLSHQECVNVYPVTPEVPSLSERALFGIPGIEQKLTTGVGEINRGSHSFLGVPYFVNGTTLYSVDDTFTATSIGTIEGTARVSMSDNGSQLMILVPGGKGYIYDGALSEITDADFTANGRPQHVVFIDSYFVCSTDSKKFIISANNDGTSWNALDFGSAEADPDVITAPVVLNNQLYIFGSETIEAFSNQALGADFPFVRTGSFAQKGSTSPYSIIVANSAVYFIGSSENESSGVWRYSGGQPEKISTRAIDSILQRLTKSEIEDIFSWSYAQKGNYFVGFTLLDTCIVFDVNENTWHERKSYVTFADSTTGTTRYRVNSVVPAYGKLLVGDMIDGRIGSLDVDIYTEYGGQILRRWSTQPFQNQSRGFSVPYIELTMESGVGNADTDDPQVMLERSLDNKTFSHPRARGVGQIGEYDKRQIWYKNGRANRFETFAFQTAAKCKIVALQLVADIIPSVK